VVQTEQTTPEQTNAAPACILCKQAKSKVVRYGVREDPERPVYRCGNCLLQWIDTPFEDLREYYREEYRKSHDSAIGETLSPEDRFRMMRGSIGEAARRFADKIPEGLSVLEIGCSSGYFLDAIQQKGYDVCGSEWNAADAAYVRDTGELPCEEGDIEDIYPDKNFGCIAALQVLEHQPEPLDWLRRVKQRLIGGGYLYLELPNATDAMLTIYGIPEYKDFWYREPHVTYWEAETLASALGAAGFEAQVSYRQRYGLINHVEWQLHGEPMPRFDDATGYWMPTPKQHPMHSIMNRLTSKLDKEYRANMETLRCADTLVAVARRIEI
jgi:SAM-dependent methyltransferase